MKAFLTFLLCTQVITYGTKGQVLHYGGVNTITSPQTLVQTTKKKYLKKRPCN